MTKSETMAQWAWLCFCAAIFFTVGWLCGITDTVSELGVWTARFLPTVLIAAGIWLLVLSDTTEAQPRPCTVIVDKQYYKVKYYPNYGSSQVDDGSGLDAFHAYIDKQVVEELGMDYAFELATGMDKDKIVYYHPSVLYNCKGQIIHVEYDVDYR